MKKPYIYSAVALLCVLCALLGTLGFSAADPPGESDAAQSGAEQTQPQETVNRQARDGDADTGVPQGAGEGSSASENKFDAEKIPEEAGEAAPDAAADDAVPPADPVAEAEAPLAATMASRATITQLAALIAQNEGGTVVLTDDIVVDSTVTISVSAATTVSMGNYGVSVNSGCALTVSGPLRFVGAGAQKPLFTVPGGAAVVLNHQCGITATGANAVAVLCNGSSFSPRFATIAVTGDNSVAVKSTGDIRLCMATVRASGQGSAGVQATGAVELTVCDVTALGSAAASGSGSLTARGSILSPQPPGLAVERIRAHSSQNGVSEKQMLRVGDSLSLPSTVAFTFDGISQPVSLPVNWDTSGVNTGAPGEYTALCYADIPQRSFPVDNFQPYSLAISVYSPTKPTVTASRSSSSKKTNSTSDRSRGSAVFDPSVNFPQATAEEAAQTPVPVRDAGNTAPITRSSASPARSYTPAPEPEAEEPLPQAAPGATAYSWRTLQDLIGANPVQVTFQQGDMRLLIPTSALSTIQMEEDELFEVELVMLSEDRFHLRLYVAGREITGFEGETLTVIFPCDTDADSEDLTCVDSVGTSLPVTLAGGRITIELTATGTYTIENSKAVPAAAMLEDAGETTAANRTNVSVPVAAGAAAAMLCVLFAAGVALYRGMNSPARKASS